MTRILITIFCILTASAVYAQQKQWKEMDEFHLVMSKTFHPAESGDLQPLKDNIDSLVVKAKAWQNSAVPAAYKTKPIKPILNKLVTDCSHVKDAITSRKSNDVVKQQITTAHKTFHEIMEKCEEGN